MVAARGSIPGPAAYRQELLETTLDSEFGDYPVRDPGATRTGEGEKFAERGGKPLLNGGTHQTAGAVKARLNGFRPDPEMARGLHGAQALDIAQDEGNPEMIRQFIDGTL